MNAPFNSANPLLLQSKISGDLAQKITLEIRSIDIQSMFSRMAESSLPDPPSQNALSLALNRILLPGITARTELDSRGKAWAIIEGQKIALDDSVGTWLQRALSGERVLPLQFDLSLPQRFLSRRILSGPSEAIHA